MQVYLWNSLVLVIVGWNWLEIAANSQEALKNGDKKYSEYFIKVR